MMLEHSSRYVPEVPDVNDMSPLVFATLSLVLLGLAVTVFGTVSAQQATDELN